MESYSLYTWAMERQQEMLREAEDRRKLKAARRSTPAEVIPFPAAAGTQSGSADEESRKESA